MIKAGNGDKIEMSKDDTDVQHENIFMEEDKTNTNTSSKSYIKRLRRYKRKRFEQNEINERQKAEIKNLAFLALAIERLTDENSNSEMKKRNEYQDYGRANE